MSDSNTIYEDISKIFDDLYKKLENESNSLQEIHQQELMKFNMEVLVPKYSSMFDNLTIIFKEVVASKISEYIESKQSSVQHVSETTENKQEEKAKTFAELVKQLPVPAPAPAPVKEDIENEGGGKPRSTFNFADSASSSDAEDVNEEYLSLNDEENYFKCLINKFNERNDVPKWEDLNEWQQANIKHPFHLTRYNGAEANDFHLTNKKNKQPLSEEQKLLISQTLPEENLRQFEQRKQINNLRQHSVGKFNDKRNEKHFIVIKQLEYLVRYGIIENVFEDDTYQTLLLFNPENVKFTDEGDELITKMMKGFNEL